MINSSKVLAKKILPLIDLTSLNNHDTPEIIQALCQQAVTPQGSVAAVCIYPHFVGLAKKLLKKSSVKIATVSNFPQGTEDLTAAVTEIQQAKLDGADEIDVVMPYTAYLEGETATAKNFIKVCKETCGEHILLKVILETGALQKETIIAQATSDMIEAGADFIKTSSGKIPIGATPEAAKVILETIHHSERQVGFKASGGIRTLEQAAIYLKLAEEIIGEKFISPKTFRFGASTLLQEVLKMLLTKPIT